MGGVAAQAILLIVYGDCRLQQNADNQLSRRMMAVKLRS